jgi:hypothetical protein
VHAYTYFENHLNTLLESNQLIILVPIPVTKNYTKKRVKSPPDTQKADGTPDTSNPTMELVHRSEILLSHLENWHIIACQHQNGKLKNITKDIIIVCI